MVEHFVLRDDAERARFFTDAWRATNYAQYYYGRRIVKLAYERFEHSEAERQRFFDLIYRTPHTTSTFVTAVAEASGSAVRPILVRVRARAARPRRIPPACMRTRLRRLRTEPAGLRLARRATGWPSTWW
jgi:hypothetical protein